MAGKPELSVASQQQQQQQQAPGVQNVVVYVSNDNFAQAYAVGQQNVAGFTSQHQTQQGSSPAVTQQNGTVVYANSTHTMASMVPPQGGKPQSFINKSLVKSSEFQTNGILENGSVAHQGNFYTCNAQPILAQNGFQQPNPAGNITNITAYHNHMGQSVPVLNNSNFDSAVKNVIGFNTGTSSTQDIYPVAAQTDKQQMPGRPEQPKIVRDESVTSETYITTESASATGYVVMGAEVTGQTGVMFPRCDSVRSETAESSCSSLSSGDSQGESGSNNSAGVVLMSTTSQPPTTQSSDIVMYDNSVSVNMRPGQSLGNLVLTMMPPGPATPQQQQIIGVPSAVTTPISITVPLGWKRIVTNDIVIYIRLVHHIKNIKILFILPNK